MAHPKESEIKQAIAAIQEAELKVDKLLTTADLSIAKIGVLQTLRQAYNRLAGLAGIATYGSDSTSTVLEQPTSIFGLPVNRPEPVAPANVQPTDPEKEALRERIAAFTDRIADGDDSDLLKVIHQPQGELIVRGAAKLAGLEDWQEAEVNTLLIQRIRAAYTEADEAAQEEAKAKAAAAKAKSAKK